jgi:RNA polymerase sigma-70 factor (ECF subfamily)
MPATPPTDLELVRGLHARDRKALARVYGDHHAAIYNLCARILGDREEAKDVTQEVFLKALERPPKPTEDVRLRPWLFRVATNTCLNLVRARRPGAGGDPDMMEAARDPYEQARSAALIEGSLAAINERYRAALVLKDLHGLDGRELADVLEVSRPAADVLVHRARASFRRAFTRLAGEDAVAPANLAVALPTLAVPAALQALPLGLAQLASASGAGTAAASGAAPAAGLLTKLAAALTSKAVVVAAGAALVAGGGVAVVELAGERAAPAPAARSPLPSKARDADAALDVPTARDAWTAHLRAVHERTGDHHSGHESGHHGARHDAGHGAGHGAGHHASHGAADHAGSSETSSTQHDGGSAGSSTPGGTDHGTTATSSSTGGTTGAAHDGGEQDHGDGHE